MGSSESTNKISGKIKMGHETLYSLDGRWDQEVFIKDKSTGVSSQSPERGAVSPYMSKR